MIILSPGELANKYGYSDINIKKYTPANRDAENIHTFIVSAEKWFTVKVEDMEDDKLAEEFNKLVEKYLKKEQYHEISRIKRNL